MGRQRVKKMDMGMAERMDEASATLIWLHAELTGTVERGQDIPLARVITLLAIVSETLRLLGKYDMDLPPGPNTVKI